jgi:hypothetical protein
MAQNYMASTFRSRLPAGLISPITRARLDAALGPLAEHYRAGFSHGTHCVI